MWINTCEGNAADLSKAEALIVTNNNYASKMPTFEGIAFSVIAIFDACNSLVIDRYETEEEAKKRIKELKHELSNEAIS